MLIGRDYEIDYTSTLVPDVSTEVQTSDPDYVRADQHKAGQTHRTSLRYACYHQQNELLDVLLKDAKAKGVNVNDMGLFKIAVNNQSGVNH